VKVFIRKYCTVKTLIVVVLLLSFNIVSFGRDINKCVGNPKKIENKSSCCKKESKGCGSEKKDVEKSNPSGERKSGKGCNSCKIDNDIQKPEGTINESKLSTLDEKTVLQESQIPLINQNIYQNTYQSESPPGIRHKLYIDISCLRIETRDIYNLF